MPSLGDVLEWLHTAWDRLQSAQGSMRLWYEPLRTRRAYEAWRHASPPGSIAPLRAAGARGDASPAAEPADTLREEAVEQYYRFWMAKPWRWRVERPGADSRGRLSEPHEIIVINGAVWWSWTQDEQHTVHTNARAAHPEEHTHSGVDRGLLVMLDPAPLLGTLRMHLAGSAEELGRQADVVQGTVRDPQPDPGLWPGADQYRLLVDRQYGILLRAEALLAGEVYAGTAFTELVLDRPIPEERFVLQVPRGARVHYY
ncbi:MAG TPA: hypothetical protein VE258_15645 [Ktedonobacterales bacterium]|nr:hypothetical protein [Ktedonobacterales bacterium]